MRLRQLAISQSIVFFAPPEVHQSILNFRNKTGKDVIDSHDVIIWLLEQTCCSIEQLQPLYISQGLEYCRRRLAAQRNPDASSQQEQRKAYLRLLEQPEHYSLENLYAPDQKTTSRPVDAKGFPQIAGYVEELNVMKKGLRNTGDTVQALAHQGTYIQNLYFLQFYNMRLSIYIFIVDVNNTIPLSNKSGFEIPNLTPIIPQRSSKSEKSKSRWRP